MKQEFCECGNPITMPRGGAGKSILLRACKRCIRLDGKNVTQFSVVQLLREVGPCTTIEVANELGWKHNRASVCLGRMRKKGYLNTRTVEVKNNKGYNGSIATIDHSLWFLTAP